MTLADNERPNVSVALCTHNGERFIEAQLRSILDQTFPPRQLVLSDDDSTDATVAMATAIIEEHSARYPERPLEFILRTNRPALGVAANFQQAILACDSELVALCDQDDVWHPDRLMTITDAFARDDDLMLLHSDARLVDEQGEPLNATLFDSLGVSLWERETEVGPDAIRVLLRRNIVTGATTVIRRALADVAMPVPSGWIHDEWLAMMAAVVGRIGIEPSQLVDYRQHDRNEIGAGKLSFAQKTRKLREPRAVRNRTLLLRAEQLVRRLTDFGDQIDPRMLAAARGKYRHEAFRSALPANRLLRVVPVLVNAARGRYRAYGMGAQDVLRDVVQPAH